MYEILLLFYFKLWRQVSKLIYTWTYVLKIAAPDYLLISML